RLRKMGWTRGGLMLFAKRVNLAAAVIGPFLLVPLFFLEGTIGELYPPAITHAEFYYAFAAVALVWQLGYFVISTDPVRFRPFMPVALLAKLAVVATTAAMLLAGRLDPGAAAAGFPDFIFVVLFYIAWMKTPRREASS
ncbi:MAG: hypothetical protein WD076_00885, partial [Parvularculaceae bacterium]